MLWRQIHRGKCEPKVYMAAGCVLGHTRLAIVGGEANSQPFIVEHVSVTFNGEIYNYKELRADLQSKGHIFTTDGDAEVLAHMYLQYGPMFVQELQGIFAFAIYDSKNQRVILCRDTIGVKPLYYTHVAGVLKFASEIKAFLERSIDPEGLSQYLQFQHCLGNTTMFSNVKKVEPGTICIYTPYADKLHIMSYGKINTATEYDSAVVYPDKIDSILHQIIKAQATGDVEVGAYISGGLDSSIVASLLVARVPNARLITGYYNVPGFTEKTYADTLVEYLAAFKEYDASRYTAFEITVEDALNALPAAIYHLDEPCAGPGLIGQYVLAKKIKHSFPNHKVMYGGQGGDELFGGYARYLMVCLAAHLYGSMYPNQKDRTFSSEDILAALPTLQGYDSMLWGLLGTVTKDMPKLYYDLICRTPDAILSRDARFLLKEHSAGLWDKYVQIIAAAGSCSLITKMSYFDFRGSLPALLQVDDRVNAAFEMESRVPLLDSALVNMAFTMPPSYKYQAGLTKGILRHAMAPHLPKAVTYRKDKMGFPVPLQSWIQQPAFKEFVVETCRSSSLATQLFTELDPDHIICDRGFWGRLSLSLWQHQFNINPL